MSDIQVHVQKRRHPYAQIDNRPLCDKRLSYRARGVLAYLLSKPATWKVRTTDIINGGTEGRDAIRAVFKELCTCGYARLHNTALGREWFISEVPEGGFPDEPSPEKPSLGHALKTHRRVSSRISNTDLQILNQYADVIYQAYPRKVGKPAAVKAIVKALTKAGEKGDGAVSAVLLGKTRDFAQCWNGDLQFCPNPSTWFNQERFNDDPSTWRRGTDKQVAGTSTLNAKNSNANRASDY